MPGGGEWGRALRPGARAARARGVKANRLNGFDYWYVIRDGERVSIAAIREEYRKTYGNIV